MNFVLHRLVVGACLGAACACASSAPAADPGVMPLQVVDAVGKVVGRYAIVSTTGYRSAVETTPAAIVTMDGALVAIPVGPMNSNAYLTWKFSENIDSLYFMNLAVAFVCATGDAFLDARSAPGNGMRPSYLLQSDQHSHVPLLYVARSMKAQGRGVGSNTLYVWQDGDCGLEEPFHYHDFVYEMGKPHDLSLIWRLPLHLE